MAVKDKKGRKLVAPDGGWGWIAVLGVSVVNLATRSIEPSFGLLFGDKLTEMGVETTGAAIIMSTLDAMINFSGLFVGPLIRIYSYRKVALFGSILSAAGLMLTAPANSMAHILATYSIIGGLGVGFAWSSTFVALNHYFFKYRGQAIGLSMAGTAVGFMAMPQAVQLLLHLYDFQGAVWILGSVALHSTVGSLLLQPIKWHLRPALEDSPATQLKAAAPAEDSEVQSPLLVHPKIEVTTISDEVDRLRSPMCKKVAMPRIISTSSMAAARRRKESVISNISSMDFTGSTFHIHSPVQSDDEEDESHIQINVLRSHNALKNDINKNVSTGDMEKKELSKVSYWKRIANFMDLDLLKDPIYLNILFGLSIFYVAELNFKMIVPFFLADLGYSKSDVAFYLSMTAIADILARVLLPPICDRLNIKRRTLFAIATVFLGVSRSVLAEQTKYGPLMAALVLNGLFRGATLINFMLTISEHCSLEKLPAAFGLHMVAKGLFIVALGPLIGAIRDITGSFSVCIHSQTVLIMMCCIAWGIEYVVVWVRRRRNIRGRSGSG